MDYKLYTFDKGLSNSYLIIDNSIKEGIIIDAGVEAAELLNVIKKNNYKIIALINTHCHIDHIYSDLIFKESLNLKIFIHKEDSKLINNPEFNLSYLFGLNLSGYIEPEILLDNDKIVTKSLNFKILHTPGHTPGSICVVEEEKKLIFSGDTLFKSSIGRTDFKGGEYESLLKSINDKILSLDDTYIVYPGHGSKTTVGEERRFNPFLKINKR
jgi:glyoxylase-like metal-dependent hydrolase (beta-lactamase superfamily II)